MKSYKCYYLGFLVTKTNAVDTWIKTRIIAGNKCYHALGHTLKESFVKHSLRERVYEIVIRSIV